MGRGAKRKPKGKRKMGEMIAQGNGSEGPGRRIRKIVGRGRPEEAGEWMGTSQGQE